jgi:hypothetical protein
MILFQDHATKTCDEVGQVVPMRMKVSNFQPNRRVGCDGPRRLKSGSSRIYHIVPVMINAFLAHEYALVGFDSRLLFRPVELAHLATCILLLNKHYFRR